MNVALCLSGYTRSYRNTFDSLYQHVIRPYDAKVFFHTWDTTDKDGDHHIGGHLQKLRELYNPKGMEVENQDAVSSVCFAAPSPFEHCGHMTIGGKPMFYGIKKAITLALESVYAPFDVIIRARFDLQFADMPKLDVDLSKLYLLEYCSNYANDWFAYGGTEVMRDYGACFNTLDRNIDCGCSTENESMLKCHIDDMQMCCEQSNLTPEKVWIRRR